MNWHPSPVDPVALFVGVDVHSSGVDGVYCSVSSDAKQDRVSKDKNKHKNKKMDFLFLIFFFKNIRLKVSSPMLFHSPKAEKITW